MADELAHSKWSLLSARLEATLKGLSLIGLLLYAIGLLVMNTYLAKYGITDFAILKPQCLLTGAWATLLLMFATFPALIFVHAISEKRKPALRRYATALLLLVSFAYTATFCAIGIFSLLAGVVVSNKGLLCLNPGVPGWRWLLIAMLVPCLLRIRQSDIDLDSPKREWLMKSFPGFIFAWIVGIFVIGFQTYESINAEMGGGRPLVAGLYLSADAKDLLTYLRHTGRPFHDDDPANTIQGELIYTTSDRYVFRIPFCRGPAEGTWSKDNIKRIDERVVIDKKVVQALLVAGVPVPKDPEDCPYKIDNFTRESVTPE
jgi:hypothetical protein